jgi:hypothetical protein
MGRFKTSPAAAWVAFARRLAVVPLLALAAGCTAIPQHPTSRSPPRQGRSHKPPPTTPQRPAPQPFRVPQVERDASLASVIEKNAATLTGMFGAPRLDVHEGDMRKLQFGGSVCVLDVYLYPLRPGAEPVATYVDARRESDGRDVDRAACVTALAKRR